MVYTEGGHAFPGEPLTMVPQRVSERVSDRIVDDCTRSGGGVKAKSEQPRYSAGIERFLTRVVPRSSRA